MMTFGAVCLHFICFRPLYYRWQMVLPEGSYLKFTVSIALSLKGYRII